MFLKKNVYVRKGKTFFLITKHDQQIKTLLHPLIKKTLYFWINFLVYSTLIFLFI